MATGPITMVDAIETFTFARDTAGTGGRVWVLRVTKRGSPDQQVDHQNKEADDSKRRSSPGSQLLARRCVLCTKVAIGLTLDK